MSTYPTFENVSEEEYLVREPEAEYRSEYRDGRVVAMSGGSPAHSLLSTNLIREVGQQLKGKPCRIYGSDLRTKVDAARLYTYPDVVVVCGESRFDVRDKYALINPTVIFEVLSPSTEAYDRGEKFAHYQKLASLRDYVLVSQKQVQVEHFSLQENGWIAEPWLALDGILVLSSIDCRVPVREIYDKIDFKLDSE